MRTLFGGIDAFSRPRHVQDKGIVQRGFGL
jgi:hypothetical protein